MEAWFNERGYRIVTEKGDSKFVYDLPRAATDDANVLYLCRWMVLNQMMEAIGELVETIDDRELMLHSDSRLVEELQGDITPDNDYAKSSLRHFIQYDYVKFRRIMFTKCSVTTVNGKLGEPINQA